MLGVYGKILHIDLLTGQCRSESLPAAIYEKYLGGKGLGAYLLQQINPPGVEPLAPENHVILTIGPANGLRIWGANRFAAFSKSPQTGIFAESYSGGKAFWPIARCGYDAFVIRGTLKEWGVLEITEQGIKIHPAAIWMGQDSLTCEASLREIFGTQAGILTIGPAGENRVRFAYVNNDAGRCLGRTGFGAILGSKKIKALVFSGNRTKVAHDPGSLDTYWAEQYRQGMEHPICGVYKKYGTPNTARFTSALEAFPARFWQDGTVPFMEKINTEALHAICRVKARSCTFCFIACTRDTTVLDGRHAGLRIDGPEYETLNAFGGLNLIDDIREIVYLNDCCDRLGLDTISAGNMTAFAIEAYKHGKSDFPLNYGDVDGIARLLEMIAYRQGIGNLLAEGIRIAAPELGLEEWSIHVKGLELPAYDPRVLKGMGLSYAVSDRGACHLRTTFYKAEMSGQIPPDQLEGKAAMLLEFEDKLTIYDSLILCRFFRDIIHWPELRKIVTGAMGLDFSPGDFRTTAAGIMQVIRNYNEQEGVTPADDRLPDFFFNRPLGSSQRVLKREEFDRLLGDYYSLRGWHQ